MIEYLYLLSNQQYCKEQIKNSVSLSENLIKLYVNT